MDNKFWKALNGENPINDGPKLTREEIRRRRIQGLSQGDVIEAIKKWGFPHPTNEEIQIVLNGNEKESPPTKPFFRQPTKKEIFQALNPPEPDREREE